MFLIGIIVIIILLGSFFCSLMEASLYSISRARIETLRRQGDGKGMILHRLRERVDEPIAAILIFNTLMNTCGAAIAGALVGRHYGSTALGVFSALLTAAILFFSEIVPKSLGFKFANRTAPMLAWPLNVLVWAFWPLVKLCVMLTNAFGPNARIAVTEDDIISMAMISEKDGSIQAHEARWIANALRLDKVSARDIMTPASVVRRVAADMPLLMTQTDADHWRFSRIPVYMPGDPEHIVGVVQRRVVFKDLVERREGLLMQDLMSPPIFVSEKLAAHELMNLFIKYRQHLFCVRDRKDCWVGIVTLEDVLEALIGTEIVGEQDIHEDMQEAARAAERAKVLTEDLRKGGGIIEHVVLSAQSGLIGKRIRDSNLPEQALVGPIVRGDAVIVPRGEVILQEGDKITLIGARKDVEAAKDKFNPEPARPGKES